ncbi:DMT family transporter [Micromonospora sp. CPCC 206061]|uniref:DMT family transporter n=1 Tax=Micromonospora sp. CPCC 206061 TaxID=3122410 RepID=UPI002FF169E8
MTRRGWLLFVAMGLIWGTPYLMIKIAVDEVSPPMVVFVRCVVGAVVLLPVVVHRKQLATLRGRWWWLIAFAAAEIVGPWLLLSDAERTLSSGTTGLLIATVPIIGVLIAWIAGDRRRVTPVRWAGLLLGFGGVALLAAPTVESGGAWPVTEMLLVAIGYAGAPLIADRALRDVPGLVVTATCLAFASLVYAPAAAWTWPDSLPSGRALLALAGLATLCTALAFVLFFELIKEVGAARATVITYVNPAVAVALGAVVLGEPLTLSVGAAFALILVGSVLATRGGVSPESPRETPGDSPAGTPDHPHDRYTATR